MAGLFAPCLLGCCWRREGEASRGFDSCLCARAGPAPTVPETCGSVRGAHARAGALPRIGTGAWSASSGKTRYMATMAGATGERYMASPGASFVGGVMRCLCEVAQENAGQG